jgi:hypothetical protein
MTGDRASAKRRTRRILHVIKELGVLDERYRIVVTFHSVLVRGRADVKVIIQIEIFSTGKTECGVR